MKAAQVLVELNKLETETAMQKADIYDLVLEKDRLEAEISRRRSELAVTETARNSLRAVYDRAVADEQESTQGSGEPE